VSAFKQGDRVRIVAPRSEWNRQWTGCAGRILATDGRRIRLLVEQTKTEFRPETVLTIYEIRALDVVERLAELA